MATLSWPSCSPVRGAVVGAALFSLAAWQPAAADPASLSPDPASVGAGNPVTVTLNDTLPAVDPVLGGVAAVGLLITFDPTLLAFQGAGLGSLLTGWDAPTWGPPIVNSPTSSSEIVSIQECADAPLSCTDAGGAGSVVTLTFLPLSDAPTISTVISAETDSNDVGAPNTYQLSPVSGTIDITAAPSLSVPAPGLFCFILPALLLIRSRRHRA